MEMDEPCSQGLTDTKQQCGKAPLTCPEGTQRRLGDWGGHGVWFEVGKSSGEASLKEVTWKLNL